MLKNLLLSTIILLVFAGLTFSDSGPSAPGQFVYPEVVDMMTLPPAPVNESILYPMHKRGESPDQEMIEKNRNIVAPVESNGPNLFKDEGTEDAITLKYNWQGPNQNGWAPADVDIAAGPLHIMVVTNEQFHIYSRTAAHTLLLTNTFQNFFPGGAGLNIFDPKVIYDPWAGRWIFMALSRSGTQSYYWVAVSQTSNPTGSWWVWKLYAHFNGGTSTTNWADYPGLGFTSGTLSTGAVVITSNQYNQSGAFQYAKVRLLKRSQLYVGGGVTWYDFWNKNNADASKVFTWKPAQNWWSGNGANVFLLNTKAGGWDKVSKWQITNPTAATPTIALEHTVSVTAYQPPPDAPMLGGGTVDAFDCRTQDVVYSNNSLFTSYPDLHNWGAGNNCVLVYLEIIESTGAVNENASLGSSGFWYIFPDVAPQYRAPFNTDSVGFSFSRAGSTIYPEARVTSYSGTTFTGSVLVEAGQGNMGGGNKRFGDYNGIAIDPKQNGHFWSAGDRGRSTSWGTGVGYFAMFSIPTVIPNVNGNEPDNYKLSQNYPNPFNPVTKISYSIKEASNVKLVVYDLLGREVRTLVNEFEQPGTYEVVFNAEGLSSGIYFYKIFAGEFSDTKRMILNK